MSYTRTYFSGNTDIQRLLENLKAKNPPVRQCGRTYTRLLHLTGQPFYGPRQTAFLYIGESQRITLDVQYEAMAILTGRGWNVHKIPPYAFGIKDTNQIFIFTTFDDWYHVTKGYKIEIAFVDVFDIKIHNLSQLKYKCNEVYYG